MPSDTWLYTVGHSNHDLPRLLDLLRSNGVTAVADVRSSPYSRRLPQFNRPELESALNAHGSPTSSSATNSAAGPATRRVRRRRPGRLREQCGRRRAFRTASTGSWRREAVTPLPCSAARPIRSTATAG